MISHFNGKSNKSSWGRTEWTKREIFSQIYKLKGQSGEEKILSHSSLVVVKDEKAYLDK